MVKHERVYSIAQQENTRSSESSILLDKIEYVTWDGKERIFPDHLIWNALAFVGISIKTNTKSYLKCAIWTARVLIHVAVLHLLGITFAFFISNHHKHPAAFMFYLALFYPLWYMALLKMKCIYSLLPQIYGYRCLLKVPSDKSTTCFITVLLHICISTLVYAAISVYIAILLDDENKTYWLYSVVIKSPAARYLFYAVGYFSYCWLMSFMPLLITLVVCSVEYRCAEVLRAINNQLRLRNAANDPARIQWLSEMYLHTVDVVQKLRDALSFVLAYHLMLNVMGLFMCLSRIILFPRMDKTGRMGSLQTVADYIACSMMIVLQVMCGSCIPEGMERIRETARLILGSNKNLGNKDADIFFHLEKFANMEPVYMTASGVLKIQRKLILSVFGALMTYGLLIINMKL